MQLSWTGTIQRNKSFAYQQLVISLYVHSPLQLYYTTSHFIVQPLLGAFREVQWTAQVLQHPVWTFLPDPTDGTDEDDCPILTMSSTCNKSLSHRATYIYSCIHIATNWSLCFLRYMYTFHFMGCFSQRWLILCGPLLWEKFTPQDLFTNNHASMLHVRKRPNTHKYAIVRGCLNNSLLYMQCQGMTF